MLKPGDKVWIGAAEIVEIQDDLWFHIAVKPNGKEFVAFASQLIPHTDNLAQIARYLAEHPETVDALENVNIWACDYEKSGFSTDCISGLAAAMRGEGGHE